MKTIEELRAIREKMKDQIDMRAGDSGRIRVVVGLATCGIASGARPVLNAIVDETIKRGLNERVTVTQTGCIGLCQYEPIVEVYEQGKEKVTYVKMTPEKAKEVVDTHLERGFVISKYTLSSTSL